MKIDLTCPVELWQYAMPAQGEGECTFTMNNLSDKVVTSVQVTLHCFDANDDLLFRQTERVQGLKAGVGERFSLVILPSEWNGVEGVDLVIEKVWFDDATVWRKGNAPLAHYEPNALPAGRALDELRFVAGPDAVGYPQVQDQVWLCVCGRANAPENQRCCRCERRRDAVFASFSQENVKHVIASHEQKLNETARKAREENNVLQENREKQRAARRRRRKKAVRLAVSGVVLAAAVVAVTQWGLPTLKYHTASQLLEDGEYDQAIAAFSGMGDYRDAETQVLECEYQKAMALLAEGNGDSMLEAEQLFLSLGTYAQSQENAKEAAYCLANLYLEQGLYEKAAERYQALGTYDQSERKLQESIYRQACAMYDAEGYEAARALLLGLNGYEPAAAKLQACTYELARGKLEAGAYQQALDELAGLDPSYQDTQLLTKQAYYALAEADVAADAYESAGERYLLAGDYSDAQAKANDCLYRLAVQTKAAGEYEKARDLFLRIPTYLDSEGQAQSCVYEQATALIDQKDYAGGAALLETIVGYGDAQAKLDECRFLQAQAALDAGDAAGAEALLESIVEYRGSVTQLKKVRYQLAQADFEAGNYSDALGRFEWLQTYRDSATKAKQCRYAIANAALEAGQYDTAIESLEALGGYKDSKELLEEARYQRAMALLGQGDEAGAKAALSDMTGSKRAAQALEEMSLKEADKLYEAGDYAAAAPLYAAYTSDTAKERLNACRYQLALALKESGDLPGAGAAFQELGKYQDAARQSEECYAAYYGQVAQQARDAMDKQDYEGVVRALHGFEMNALSGSYQDLPELYNEACYQIAEQLYRDGKPYEAIAYYQQVGDYRDAREEKLGRGVYLILGQWQSATGKTAVFRMDGTCDLMGEELCYQVSNVRLLTGPDPEHLTLTHKLSRIDENSMSLRDIRDGADDVYKFTRVGEYSLPLVDITLSEAEAPAAAPTQGPEETPAPADPLDEMLVTGDEDEPEA